MSINKIMVGFVLSLVVVPFVTAVGVSFDEEKYTYGEIAHFRIYDCVGPSLVQITDPEGVLVSVDQQGGNWKSFYDTSSVNTIGKYSVEATCFSSALKPTIVSTKSASFVVELPLVVETNKDTYEWGEKIGVVSIGCEGVSKVELSQKEGDLLYLDQGKDIWGSKYDTGSYPGSGTYVADLSCGSETRQKELTVTFPLAVQSNKYRYSVGGEVIATVTGCMGVSSLEVLNLDKNVVFTDQGVDVWGTQYSVQSDAKKGMYTLTARCGEYLVTREVCVGTAEVCGSGEEQEEQDEPKQEDPPVKIQYVPMQCGDTCDFFETISTCPNVCSCPDGIDCAGKDADADGLSDVYEDELQKLWKQKKGDGSVGFDKTKKDTDGDGIHDGVDYCPGTYTSNGVLTFANGYVNSIGCYIGDVAYKQGSFAQKGPDGCFDGTDFARLALPYKFWEGVEGLDACPSHLAR